MGAKSLSDKYLTKDSDNKPIELPQHMFMGIAMFMAQNEDDCMRWAVEFYNTLSKLEAMPGTPTISNARRTRHQLSSCFVGVCPDTTKGITDTYGNMANISRLGGGIGWDFTKCRCLGSDIDNRKKAAGGVIPVLKTVNDIGLTFDQLGVRLGAIAVYLGIWHGDILDLLDLKKNSGEERRRAHDLFPAMWLNDLFMERVQEFFGSWKPDQRAAYSFPEQG